MLYFLILIVAVAAAFGYRYWLHRKTHENLLASTLSEHQRQIIAQQVPLSRRLPSEHRSKLEGKIQAFLNQVEFMGCNGLDVTEEMELSIAAQACLLITNSDSWYDNLHTILIYPGAFKSQQASHNGYVVTEREIVRTGESWSRGPVILSWAHSQQGALNERDGHNVVFHEFAHQLDDLSGHTNGVPNLDKSQTFGDWERVFVEAFARHVQHVQTGHKTAIDAYGAEGHEEFFAVSVQHFFERTAALKRQQTEGYEQLVLRLKLDPSTWS